MQSTVSGAETMALNQAERQLILLSAGTAARRHQMRELAQSLVAGGMDWPALAHALLARRLLTTLGPRILELADGLVDDAFAEQVEQATIGARRQSAFLQLVSQRATSALFDAGIRATTLKGPMLAETLYGDPGRRLSGDIDLLVAPEQIHEAVEIVGSLGYGPPSDHVDRQGLPLLHFTLQHEQGMLPPIELHWRIHWYERSFASERLLPPRDEPADVWRPAPADELIALLLFYARDGFVDLRLATDVGAWWDAFGVQVREGALDERLRSYPQLVRAVRVAARVAHEMVGLPMSVLGKRSKPTLRDRMAARLANPNPRAKAPQLYADIGLIDGLLSPPGSFGSFMGRQVWLSREVLDERARRLAKTRVRSPLSHGAGTLLRYVRTIVRLTRAPETLR